MKLDSRRAASPDRQSHRFAREVDFGAHYSGIRSTQGNYYPARLRRRYSRAPSASTAPFAPTKKNRPSGNGCLVCAQRNMTHLHTLCQLFAHILSTQVRNRHQSRIRSTRNDWGQRDFSVSRIGNLLGASAQTWEMRRPATDMEALMIEALMNPEAVPQEDFLRAKSGWGVVAKPFCLRNRKSFSRPRRACRGRRRARRTATLPARWCRWCGQSSTGSLV
jgi:hypothetical protein